MPRLQTNRGDTVAVLTLVLIGLLTTLSGALFLWQSASTYFWEETTGVVVESNDLDGSSRPQDRYNPHLIYRYEVAGKPYRSDRISYAPFLSRSYTRQLVDALPEGEKVVVHYDDGAPERAVLVVGGAAKSVLLLTGGLMALVLGLWLYFRR